MDLKKLFAIGSSPSTPTDIAVDGGNSTQIQEKETYTQYGIRICGMTTGRINALEAHLNRVYNIEVSRQREDEAFQQSKKDELAAKKAAKESNLSNEEAKIKQLDLQKQTLEDQKAEIRIGLDSLKANEGELNRLQRMKLIISLFVIVPLTIYLFIFYSSTFYSAFFKEFAYGQDLIGEAMFDGQAIPNAIQHGFGELMFILFAPVIFLGFGTVIHFTLDQKGYFKYFICASLVVVTFMFDGILAYLIGEKLYLLRQVDIFEDLPPFNLSEAFGDPNFWAVIFCGFIVYIIWGFLFHQAMSAYDHMRSNKEEIVAEKTKIENINKKIHNIEAQIIQIQNNIKQLKGEIARIETALSQSSFINTARVRAALNDFYAGWMQVMNTFNHEEESRCPEIFDRIFTTLCPE